MVATRRDQRCTEHSGHIDYPAASAALAACWIASAVLKAGGRVGRLLARPAMRRFDFGEGKGRGGKPSNGGGESKRAAPFVGMPDAEARRRASQEWIRARGGRRPWRKP